MRYLSILATSLIFFGAFEASAATDRNTMCTRILSTISNYDADSEGYKSLREEHKENCTAPAGSSEEFWRAAYPKPEENRFLSAAPSRMTSVNQNAESVEDALAKNQADHEGMFDDCKKVCATSEVNCRGTIANAKQVGDSDYSRVYGLMSGNEASVTQGCNSISNYQATAESQMNSAQGSCQNYKTQCDQVCENARSQSSRSVSIGSTAWMSLNEKAGTAYSQSITTQVSQGQSQISSNVQALNNQCTNAKQQLAQAKIDKANQKKDQVEDKKNQNQLGNALQSLGSQLGQQAQDNTQLPYDPYAGSAYSNPTQTNQNTMYTAPNNLGAVKGAPDYTSSGRIDDAGILDDGMGQLPPHERSKFGQTPQQAGGGAAGVGGGGGGQQAGAKGAKRGGRSRYDSDVYKGAMGGGGPGSTRGGGDGYPTEGQGALGRGGRVGAGGGGVGPGGQTAASVNLQKFLPQRMAPRRQIANTTGPDGITGPHTDLFKKVRNRYSETILDDH